MHDDKGKSAGEGGGKRAAVVGLGASGTSAARLLVRLGYDVVATDAASRERLSKDALALEALGVSLRLGAGEAGALLGRDLVVVSPGVPGSPALLEAEKAGAEVIGELELASRHLDAPIVLVGGTNGKSTTTALVHEIMRSAGRRSFVGGNFGTPLSEAVGGDWDVCVVEISSFQAERVPTLRARAAALLNVTDDHLDRYPDFEAYLRAKGNPFERMGRDDFAVIPAGDPAIRRQAERGSATIVTFDGKGGRADVMVKDGAIVDRLRRDYYPLHLLRIAGAHNVDNACAAVALSASMGVEARFIAEALSEFRGLEHRTSLVAEVRGVRYYDDSKGTNVGASVAALSGLSEPKAVLIAGGRDKLGDYGPLVAALAEKGRALVLIGEAAARIAEAARGKLDIPVEQRGSLEEAVVRASELARPGDAVLLSPACSSFDMFRDYKQRGDAFVAAVRALTEGKAGHEERR